MTFDCFWTAYDRDFPSFKAGFVVSALFEETLDELRFQFELDAATDAEADGLDCMVAVKRREGYLSCIAFRRRRGKGRWRRWRLSKVERVP